MSGKPMFEQHFFGIAIEKDWLWEKMLPKLAWACHMYAERKGKLPNLCLIGPSAFRKIPKDMAGIQLDDDSFLTFKEDKSVGPYAMYVGTENE